MVSPIRTISLAYLYLLILILVFYSLDFYSNSSFFSWGPPVSFFGKKIESNKGFYLLLLVMFFHQLVNNSVNTIVYPWIINCVQDPKNKEMEYSNLTCIILINLFDLYSQVDTIFIVMGFMSQISFVIVLSLANVLVSTYVNLIYLKKKKLFHHLTCQHEEQENSYN